MSRIWLTCALATAALVVAAIYLLPKKEPDRAPTRTPPPPPLKEQEVRLYIEVYPSYTDAMARAALEFQRQRIAGDVNAQAQQAETQAAIDALLERFHLAPMQWRAIQDRVEYAFNTVRAADEHEKMLPTIRNEILVKRQLLEKLGDENDRKVTLDDIAALEARLGAEMPPLRDEDRELIRRYWRDLEPIVPRRGAPPPRQPSK
jgi:hypothetical protein